MCKDEMILIEINGLCTVPVFSVKVNGGGWYSTQNRKFQTVSKTHFSLWLSRPGACKQVTN